MSAIRRLAGLCRNRFGLSLALGFAFLLMGGANRDPETGPQLLEQEASWPGQRHGPALQIAVDGHFAYVATGPGGLVILDVSNPANPIRVGDFWAGGSTFCVAIAGSRAYVGSGIHEGGGCVAFQRGLLQVLDVADPGKPRLLGSFRMPREAKQIQIIGQRAYVLGSVDGSNSSYGRNAGLEVLDVSDPAHIQGVNSRYAKDGTSLWVDGSRAAVAGGRWNRVLYVGNADPASVTWTSQLTGDFFDPSSEGVPPGRGLWISGQHAYLVGGPTYDGMSRLDILRLDPKPSLIASMTTETPLLGIQVVDNHAFAAASDGGLLVLDVAQPSTPKTLASLPLPGCAVGLTLAGPYAYVASYDGGMHIVDIANHSKPALVGSYRTGLTTRNVRLDGNRAYILSSDRHPSSTKGQSRIDLLDLTTPSAPIFRGFHATDGIVKDYGTGNSVVSLLVQRGILPDSSVDSTTWEVIDWIDPTTPHRVAQRDIPGGTQISISGTRAYVPSSDGNGLQIFDLTQPANPRVIGNWSMDISAIDVREDIACIAGYGSIQFLNVSNPARPVLLSQLQLDEWIQNPKAIHLSGDLAYLLRFDSIGVMNLKDPAKPAVLGNYAVGRDCRALGVEGGYAFVAKASGNVGMVDVTDPMQPRAVAEWGSGTDTQGLEVRDGRLYVADAGAGLIVLKRRQDLALITPPESLVVAASEPATLRVAATAGGPIAYQWYSGPAGGPSAPISGATGPELTFPQVSEDVSCWVRIQSGGQTVDSPAAQITVKPAMSLAQVSAWPGYRMGEAYAVKVQGHHAYVASGSGGLMIFDVSNPSAPERLDGIETGGWAQDLAVAGPFAYVTDGNLTIYDVTNPSKPQRMGYYQGIHPISKMDMGDAFLACVVSWWDGSTTRWTLDIIDVRNPVHPQPRGSYSPGFPAGSEGRAIPGLAIQGTRVFLATSWYTSAGGPYDYHGRMTIIDLADLDHPTLIGAYEIVGSLRDIAIHGSIAYLVKSVSDLTKLELVDVASPNLPKQVASYNLTPNFGSIFLNPPYAYLSGSGQLQILDIGDASKPSLLNGVSEIGEIRDMTFAGGRAYVAKGGDGLEILDIKDPIHPSMLSVFDTDRSPKAIGIAQSHVLASDGNRIHLIDFDTNTPPRLIGQLTFENPAPVEAMAVQGAYAYVGASTYVDANSPGQFQIFDLADPTTPRKVTGYSPDESSGVFNITVADNLAYVASDDTLGLQVLNVSNPAKPMPIGGYGECTGPIALDGNIAFVAAGDGGVGIMDVSTPAAPRRIDSFFPRGKANDIVLAGHRLIVAIGQSWNSPTDIQNGLENDNGLEILDVSNPRQPVLVSRVLRGTSCLRVAVQGPLAFVLTDQGTTAVVDLTQPNQPCVVAIANTPEAGKLALSGDTLYLAQGTYGVTAWRLQPRHRLNHPMLMGDKVRLSWLASPGLRLQRASSLAIADWQDVPGSEGIGQLDLPFTEAAGYFRLKSP